jgi:FKBP-type peptidyl-prolyl cis-trans isomerase
MSRWIVSVTLAALALAPTAAHAASTALSPEANQAYLTEYSRKPGVIAMRDGVLYRIIKPGFGSHPTEDDLVTVYYSLKLINGKKVQGTEPDFPSQMPVGGLIPGWQEAMKTMRVGDRWELVIPSNLGYGPRGTTDGTVPPNQTLIFDVELLKTVTPPRKPSKNDDDNQTPVTPPAAGTR